MNGHKLIESAARFVDPLTAQRNATQRNNHRAATSGGGCLSRWQASGRLAWCLLWPQCCGHNNKLHL